MLCRLTLTALPINWALGDEAALVRHSRKGSVALVLDGGGSSVTAGDGADNATAFRIAHGTLMLAAFVLLMPTAVLMARHKWLFGDSQVCGAASLAGWGPGLHNQHDSDVMILGPSDSYSRLIGLTPLPFDLSVGHIKSAAAASKKVLLLLVNCVCRLGRSKVPGSGCISG